MVLNSQQNNPEVLAWKPFYHVSNGLPGIPRCPTTELNGPTLDFRKRDEEQIDTRKDPTLLAQLRAGHCRHLKAYSHLMNENVDPNCPKCHEEPQTLEHWMNCQSTAACQELFGTTEPRLELLSEEARLVDSACQKNTFGRWLIPQIHTRQ